jgi:uncharacterized protein (TIGR03435 family)
MKARFACLLLIAGSAGAQAPAPLFEVAAIRAASLPTPDSFRNSGGQFRAGTRITADTADFDFLSLADLLPYAFGVKSFQVAGPASLRETRWNIQAKLPTGASQDQVPQMLQSLLADRFKLATHHEKREIPVYELTVGNGGPKLEEASEPAPITAPALPGLFPGMPFVGPGAPANPNPQQDGGGRGRGFAFAGGGLGGNTRITPDGNCSIRLEFSSLTMASLAETLTPMLDKPVLDATNLKGSYKASLKLPIEAMLGLMQNTVRGAGLQFGGNGGFGGRGGDAGGGDAGRGGGRGALAGCDPAALAAGISGDSSSAPLFQAVQQLGLKLQARKAPFDTIVVDHVEKTPTEN